MVCAMFLDNNGNIVQRLESLDLVRGKSDIVVAYLDNQLICNIKKLLDFISPSHFVIVAKNEDQPILSYLIIIF